jgi:hypothetical protein
MATFATEPVPTTGLAATARTPTPTTGDKVRPDSIIRVINGSASEVTVTMVTPQVVDGNLAVADRTVAVPATSSRYIRTTATYRSTSDGLVTLIMAPTATVTFEVIS